MKAGLMMRERRAVTASSFLEIVLWRVPAALAGSAHRYKYRLAYVVNHVCVLRYDNEAGKGDHRHVGTVESGYSFTTIEKLIADFQKDVARWNDENRNS